MEKTVNQRISEETGIDLSPEAIARDRKLRALYEAIIAAKGTREEAAARQAFVEFVRKEYP